MPARDLELLIEAARMAGEIAMRFWRRDLQVWQKSDQSPITEADLAVNVHLHQMLRQNRPDYGWLSEETEDSSARLGAEYVFIIDPIDGTRSFIAGETTFSISIAVAQQGKVTAAVVYLPALDRLYSAQIGGQAFKNGNVVTVSSTSQIAGATILANKAAFEQRHWPNGVPEAERVLRSSIAYRLCLVAEGRHDAMVVFGNIYEWDIAAGALIAHCAGAKVTNLHGVAPTFNKNLPQSDGILAASLHLHQALRGRM
ncbi:MAG: myo-inositol-1(or 4)-monophosphatase [Paracoccaceae bacterium]